MSAAVSGSPRRQNQLHLALHWQNSSRRRNEAPPSSATFSASGELNPQRPSDLPLASCCVSTVVTPSSADTSRAVLTRRPTPPLASRCGPLAELPEGRAVCRSSFPRRTLNIRRFSDPVRLPAGDQNFRKTGGSGFSETHTCGCAAVQDCESSSQGPSSRKYFSAARRTAGSAKNCPDSSWFKCTAYLPPSTITQQSHRNRQLRNSND